MNLPLLNLLLIVSLLTFHQLFYLNQSSSEQSLPENGGTVCQVQAFLAVAHDEASDLQVLQHHDVLLSQQTRGYGGERRAHPRRAL